MTAALAQKLQAVGAIFFRIKSMSIHIKKL